MQGDRANSYGARAARVRDAGRAYRCPEVRDALLRLAAAYEALAARGAAADRTDDAKVIFGRPDADRCRGKGYYNTPR